MGEKSPERGAGPDQAASPSATFRDLPSAGHLGETGAGGGANARRECRAGLPGQASRGGLAEEGSEALGKADQIVAGSRSRANRHPSVFSAMGERVGHGETTPSPEFAGPLR